MDVMMFVLWFAVGFVFGSVPSGLWLVKAIHGIDIREYGSKNIGSTNVFRTVGGKTAALVLLCDAGKGIIAVMIAQSMTGGDLYAMLFAAIGALLGHNYSLFLGFKGGRGVATGLGLLIFLMPKVSGICFIVWLAIVLATRYVSLGSCVGAFCAPNPLCFAGQLRGCVLRAVPCVVFRVSAAGVFVCRRCGSVCNYPP